MCMVMPSLFVNFPTVICSPNMLILMGETPLVNCGLRSILLHRIQSTAILVSTVFCKHHLPHYTSNPLFTASRWDWQPHCYVGAKYFDCVVQVPRWRRNAWCCVALHSAAINLQRASWLLLVRLNLGFLLRENLPLYASHLPLGVPNGRVLYAYQALFLAPLPGRSRHAARGVSHIQSL